MFGVSLSNKLKPNPWDSRHLPTGQESRLDKQESGSPVQYHLKLTSVSELTTELGFLDSLYNLEKEFSGSFMY